MPRMLGHPYREVVARLAIDARMNRQEDGFFEPSSPPFRRHPSDQGYTVGLEAFLAVDDFDPNPLAGTKSVDAAATQGGDMYEHVLATAVGRNESVAFFGLKPFDRSLHRRGGTWAAAVHPAGSALRQYRRTAVGRNAFCDPSATVTNPKPLLALNHLTLASTRWLGGVS